MLWLTETNNPATRNLDTLSTTAMLLAMNAEDQQVPRAVAQAIPAIAPVVDAIAEAFAQGGRLVYVGAGTSGRLGVLDASECPPTFSTPLGLVQGIIAGGPPALTQAIEGAEDDGPAGQLAIAAAGISAKDVVVGVSASGSAAFVREALRAAQQVGAYTAAMVCVPPDTETAQALVPFIQQLIAVPVGPEVLQGSTRLKAGTAQKLVLNMLSTLAMVRWGKTYGNVMIDVAPTNQKLRARAVRIVSSVVPCTDAEAQNWLAQAGGRVKVAVVMARLSCTAPMAEAQLAQVGGQLRKLIDLIE